VGGYRVGRYDENNVCKLPSALQGSLLLLLAGLTLVGCPSEPPAWGDPAEPVTGDNDPEAEFGTVEGHVRAPSGALLPQVTITLGTLTTTSDVRGWFRFQPVVPGEDLVLVASRDGLSTARRTLDVAAGQALQVGLVLAAARQHQLPQATPGPEAVVQTVDGVTVEFVDGTFTDAAGGIVDGPVDLAITLLNTPESVSAAPGMLAQDVDGAVFGLESFGMVEVVLTAAGAPVTFSGAAVVSFPLVAGHGFADGDAIPLWWFDEALGYWVQEGEGTVDDGRFVAEVTHFSWWNADAPLGDTGCVSGALHTPSGEPAADFVVNAFGLDFMGGSQAVTDASGGFCVPLKLGGEALLTAIGGDGAAIWSWEATVIASEQPSSCGVDVCVELGDVSLSDLTDDQDGDGYTELAGDCDDADPSVSPGAIDALVDGQDENCDGLDGPDLDGDGVAAQDAGGTDCDDSLAAVRPGALEWCNGIDDDCDGEVDEAGAQDGVAVFGDTDGDGFGDPADVLVACGVPEGYSAEPTDCDDTDPLVHPDARESCGGDDEDCDGQVDEGDADDALTWFADLDGDGYGDGAATVTACLLPVGAVPNAADCADDDPAVNPGAVEQCNGVDDDCDLVVDQAGSAGESQFFADADGDGYGVASSTLWACLAPSGWSLLAGDCDDGDPATNPGAVESCADVDDLNCDGSVQFADADADGSPACLDCDDSDPTVLPGAVELCDLVDTDCDGSLVDYFVDTDGDGSPDCVDLDDDGDGDPDLSDCGPLDPTVYAGAPEACDSVDSDCDGGLVDGAADLDADGSPDCVDLDDDGDGDPDATDCAPTDPSTYAGAPELCDGLDNDCDGVTDACAGTSADAVVYGEGSAWNLGAALGIGDLDDDGQQDLVVASPGAGAAIGVGALHIFSGPVSGALFPAQADMVVLGEVAEDWAGTSVAADCDLNGDGADDLVVGAWGYDWTGAASGAVYVLYGPLAPLNLLSSADATFYGESPGDWAGWSVDCAGDTNADGYDDAIVGAWRDDDAGIDAGAAYLLAGPLAPGTIGTLDLAAAKLVGESAFDYAGVSVAGAGDVDGDGFDDVLVGAGGRDESGTTAGAAYLVRGPITGTSSLALADARLLGAAPGDRAGELVAGAGDVNGDGFADLLVGAWSADGVGTDAGAGYLFHGPVSGVLSLSTADAVLLGQAAGDQLGTAGGAAGDVNGDGFDDVLIGAPGRDVGSVDSGAGYLSLGGATLQPVSGAAATWPGEGPGDRAGSALVGGRDLDGDGVDDVLVGAPYNDEGLGDAGSAYLQSGAGL